MGDEEPRNLLLNWCERGPSLAEAARELQDVTPWWETPDFEDRGSDEYRAAMTVFILTGLKPELRDSKGNGDGRADLLLRPQTGNPQLVEVLSTLDRRMQEDQRRAYGLMKELNGDIPPVAFFPVSLEIGWDAPYTRKDKVVRARWRAVTARARDEASRGDLSDETREELHAVFPSMKVGAPRQDEARSGFNLVSHSARVKSSEGRPYLERFTDYLRESERGGHHTEKLEREAEATGADRLHLYLLVASTGEWGNLLASSPSYLTEGDFDPPESLTDIWLDGGNGYVYRWQRERGWTYHESD